MQNPTTGKQSSVSQTTAEKMKTNNSSGNQNASQNPDQTVKPKFKCKDCEFNCSSLQNFRIHLQMAHQTTNETIERLSALKMAVQEIKKLQPVKNFQPETMKVNPAGNVQSGPPNMAPTISKPFIPNAQAIKNMNPAGNAQPGAPQMAPAVRKPFVPNVQGIMVMNPAGNVRPGAQKIRKPFIPKGIKNMNPAGNAQLGASQMAHLVRKPFVPNAQVIKKLDPEANVKSAQQKPLWKPTGNVQPVEEIKSVSYERNVLVAMEKQKSKYTFNVQQDFIPESSSGRDIAKLKDYMSRRDREPLIGLEYVLEYNIKMANNRIETKYFCELCECDLELDPMVEHLAGFGHRKLYLAKEYPYVLKAQSNSKEDPSKFIRRMALEIEREEGTKMYLVDSSMWTETMMTLRTAERKMRKKSRWADEKNDETRMKKALAYLESFEIDSEIEATTVTRLCEKLTANLKLYSTRAKEDALFPTRVARAQDVATSLIKNAANQRTRMQNATLMTGQPNIPAQQNKGPPTLPGNANLENKVGMQSDFSGKKIQYTGAVQNMPNIPPYQQGQQNAYNPSINAAQNLLGAPLYQQAQQNAFVPPVNANQNMPKAPPYQIAWKKSFIPLNANQAVPEASTPKENETSRKPDDSFLKSVSPDDTQFFKKLVSLLDAIPQNAPSSEGTQSNSKLHMLKSLLASQKNAEQEQANQKLMAQIAFMVKDTITAQNANLNQQLLMLLASQNSSAMAMQTASHNSLMAPMQLNENSVMNQAGLVSGMQSVGNMPMNRSSMMPYQNVGAQVYGQMGEMATTSMNPNAYQVPPAEMQNYPSTSQAIFPQPTSQTIIPQPTSQTIIPQPTSQTLNYGYGNSAGNSYTSQRDGINSMTAMQSEQARIPYTNVGDKPSVYDKQWGNSYGNSSQVVEPKYDDFKEQPYSRGGLPPSSSQTPQNDYYNARGEIGIQEPKPQNSSRSYSSDWDDQAVDVPYTKRARLDMDNQSNRFEYSTNKSLESLGINTAGMPEELLKRLRGKDLFTASAILSEYSERHSGK